MSYHFIGKSLVVLLVALCCSIWGLEAQRSEQGIIIQIVDNVDRMPVIGAQLRLGRSNYFSDADGKIRISTRSKPQTKITVTSIGYHSQTIAVGALQFKQGHCTLSLIPTQETLGTLTVSAERREASVNAVSTKVSSADISHSLGKSLASLLEGVSGVSSIQTGANTAKPVIHGMHGNRILIVNNGVRQAGQQWDEGHAPEVDMSGSDAIHVIKGAESVRYGSEAMGGTIVLEQKKLPYYAYAHPFSIKSNNLYATNGKQFSHALSVEGMTTKLPNLAWRAHVSYSNSGDKHSARYMLNNTGSREFNFSVALGYDLLSSKVLGGLRIEPFYSRYSEYSAAPTYAQLGNVFLLKERLRLGRPPQEIILPFTRHIGYPKEGVVHHLASNKTTWTTAHWGTLLHQISYQLDRRQEFRIRRNNNSHIPEIDLSLMSLQNKLRWDKTYGAFQTEAGAQHLYTENHSIPGNGVVPPIPNYAEMSWGIYAIEKYNGKKWNAEAGVRIDDQRSKAAGYDAFTEAYGGEQHFFNITYSLGTRFRPNRHWSITSNLGAAWRAPHVHELYSNGVQHGAGAYVVGDTNLKSEQSYKWVNSIGYKNSWLSVSLDGFVQWVNNFIYDEPVIEPDGTPSTKTTTSGSYPVFQYKQTAAFFRGVDLDLQIEPIKNLRYGVITALVLANERQTGAYLPYIPPMRIDHSLSWSHQINKQVNLGLSLGHRFVTKQTRFEPNKDLVNTTPDAYHLVNGSASLGIKLKGRAHLELSILGDNILNEEYKEYTNRGRYYAHDLGRDIRFALSVEY